MSLTSVILIIGKPGVEMMERLYAEDRIMFLEQKLMEARVLLRNSIQEYEKLEAENNSLKEELSELKKKAENKPASKAGGRKRTTQKKPAPKKVETTEPSKEATEDAGNTNTD
jgi:regulator of replication initiation timing